MIIFSFHTPQFFLFTNESRFLHSIYHPYNVKYIIIIIIIQRGHFLLNGSEKPSNTTALALE